MPRRWGCHASRSPSVPLSSPSPQPIAGGPMPVVPSLISLRNPTVQSHQIIVFFQNLIAIVQFIRILMRLDGSMIHSDPPSMPPTFLLHQPLHVGRYFLTEIPVPVRGRENHSLSSRPGSKSATRFAFQFHKTLSLARRVSAFLPWLAP